MIENESSYKWTIMNDSWQLDGVAIDVAEQMKQLNALRNDVGYIEENDHLELALAGSAWNKCLFKLHSSAGGKK